MPHPSPPPTQRCLTQRRRPKTGLPSFGKVNQMERSKAPTLKAGDVVGIVSPSWGGAGLFPHQVQRGVEQLERMGFKVRLGRHALNCHGFVSDSPENRVADIHDFFADPNVRLIMAAIGGDHSCHLLPLLDFDLIRRNAKAFVGYSDNTVLNIAFWTQAGLVTFNGPCLLTDLGEFPAMLNYSRHWFLRALCSAEPVGRLSPSPEWTEEQADWEHPSESARERVLRSSRGWTFLKPGAAKGVLVGGCLESLQHLRGTRFWPKWRDAVFFFETSEEAPSPQTVDGILADYDNMGVFSEISAMLVGRPMRYDDSQKQALRDALLQRTAKYSFPIVTDMDFGHTAPQLTLPIGCHARINSDTQVVEIIESGTA